MRPLPAAKAPQETPAFAPTRRCTRRQIDVLCPGAMKSYSGRPNVPLLIFVRFPSVLFPSTPFSIRETTRHDENKKYPLTIYHQRMSCAHSLTICGQHLAYGGQHVRPARKPSI